MICEFLALTTDAGWLGWIGLLAGPAALILVCACYYKLDNRYERKDTAKEKAASVAKERQDEVEHLKAADTRVERMVAELSETVKKQDKNAQDALTTLRGEMNKGFIELTKTISDGVLSLTKEVAIMQGRLAGAGGVVKE